MWEKYLRNTGLVVVLSGPSGVGKGTVLAEFLRLCPKVKKCVTYTTRQIREGEESGRDYHFVSIPQFRDMVEAGRFLEWAEVHGNLYGSTREYIEETVQAGQDVVLEIDIQGGMAVKKQLSDAVMVFLVPPSIEELERRLRFRLTESEEQIAKRLLNAQSELLHISSYEYLIVNDTVAEAAAELEAIIIAERNRIRRAAV